MQAGLRYLSDDLILSHLAEIGLRKSAGIGDDIAAGIKEFSHQQYQPDKPYASLVNFFTKGLLAATGFWWVDAIYVIMEALGFDWTGFWSSLGNAVLSFLKSFTSEGKRPTLDELSPVIDTSVQQSMTEHFSGEVDPGKLTGILQRQAFKEEDFYLLINSINLFHPLTKNALSAPFGLKNKLIRFLSWFISKALKMALLSVGIVIAVGAAKGLIKGLTGKETNTNEPDKTVPDMVYTGMSKDTPADFFTSHRNDSDEIWVERGEISNIQSNLLSWISTAYPTLNDQKDELQASTSFQLVLRRFLERNKLASGLGIFAIPRPFERKIDIITFIVSAFLKEHPVESKSNQPSTTNIGYQYAQN